MPVLRRWLPMLNVVIATRAAWYWLLRVIMTAWVSDVARTKAAEHKQENKFLRRALGKRADSIWLANKDDLVRMAVHNPRRRPRPSGSASYGTS